MVTSLPVAPSVDALLAGATEITPLDSVGKSGARIERVRWGDRVGVVKYLDLETDWILRAAGVPGGATLVLWCRGLLHRLPECFNQPVVGVAHDGSVTALLMEDVGEWLVASSDDPVPLEQHLRFLDHMAALHAAFWESELPIDIVSTRRRLLELSPHTAAREAARGCDHPVPALIGQGWPLLAEVAPEAAAIVQPLAWDPGPLLEALRGTPQTLVHGDWKLDNLGSDPAGRTVLLDWSLPGRGPALSDLAWYLAINCRRLPQPKEDAIDAYRAALERYGVRTDPWWSRQLALCLLGGLVQFGWDKAYGGYDDELAWWEARAVEAAPLLS